MPRAVVALQEKKKDTHSHVFRRTPAPAPLRWRHVRRAVDAGRARGQHVPARHARSQRALLLRHADGRHPELRRARRQRPVQRLRRRPLLWQHGGHGLLPELRLLLLGPAQPAGDSAARPALPARAGRAATGGTGARRLLRTRAGRELVPAVQHGRHGQRRHDDARLLRRQPRVGDKRQQVQRAHADRARLLRGQPRVRAALVPHLRRRPNDARARRHRRHVRRALLRPGRADDPEPERHVRLRRLVVHAQGAGRGGQLPRLHELRGSAGWLGHGRRLDAVPLLRLGAEHDVDAQVARHRGRAPCHRLDGAHRRRRGARDASQPTGHPAAAAGARPDRSGRPLLRTGRRQVCRRLGLQLPGGHGHRRLVHRARALRRRLGVPRRHARERRHLGLQLAQAHVRPAWRRRVPARRHGEQLLLLALPLVVARLRLADAAVVSADAAVATAARAVPRRRGL